MGERCEIVDEKVIFNWSPIPGIVAVVDSNKMGEDAIFYAARICRGQKLFAMEDEKKKLLFKFLLTRKHLKPFDFASLTYYIKAPIFVERQLRVYRTATILERSLRACEPFEGNDGTLPYIKEYNELIRIGEPKEIARRVLPLSAFTSFFYQMNVRNLLHLFDERLTKETQLETRLFAQLMWKEFEQKFPLIANIYKQQNEDLLFF